MRSNAISNNNDDGGDSTSFHNISSCTMKSTSSTSTSTFSSSSSSSSTSSLWTGTVIKETVDSSVGISFIGEGTHHSPILIAGIQPNGLFDRLTNLCAGLRVISVNGIYVGGGGGGGGSSNSGCWSARRLGREIRNARPGPITVVAQGVVVTCPKKPPSSSSSPSSSIGIQLYRNPSFHAIMVSRISRTSYLFGSDLKIGRHRLTRVQNEPCPLTTRECADRLLGRSRRRNDTNNNNNNNKRMIHIVAVDVYVPNLESIRREAEKAKMENSTEHRSSCYYYYYPQTTFVSAEMNSTRNNTPTNHSKNNNTIIIDPLLILPHHIDEPNKRKQYYLRIQSQKKIRYGGVGLILVKDRATSGIFIKAVDPSSIFYDLQGEKDPENHPHEQQQQHKQQQQHHILRNGRVIAINGFACPSDTLEAVRLIQSIERDIWFDVDLAEMEEQQQNQNQNTIEDVSCRLRTTPPRCRSNNEDSEEEEEEELAATPILLNAGTNTKADDDDDDDDEDDNEEDSNAAATTSTTNNNNSHTINSRRE